MGGPEAAHLLLVRRQERVAVVGRRNKRLLDGPRANPTDQVPQRPRLVVGAGSPGAAEGLLPDYRAGRFVVDIKVAGRIAQDRLDVRDGRPVAREYRSGESVRRAAVDATQHIVELSV